MEKLPQDISMEDVMRMIKSPAGQQLIKVLGGKDPKTLQNAVENAKSGNLQEAKNSIESLIASDDLQKILKDLGG